MSKPIEDTVDHRAESSFADAFFSPAPNDLAVTFGAATHVGKVRAQNEDNFAVFRLRRTVDHVLSSLASEDLAIHETRTYAMVVADGMGGMRSGEVASRVALQTMVELMGQATSWVMKLTDLNAQQIEQRVEAFAQRIHATLQEQGKADPAKASMGTTWTSAHLLGSTAVVVHIGDSRAYLFRDKKLTQVTRDETMAQSLIETGMDPSSVARFRHILLNSFGGGNEVATASIHGLELSPGDQLLLCSDGLTDMVSDQQIGSELSQGKTAQSACDALVELALENGGKDNVTVALAVIGSEQESG